MLVMFPMYVKFTVIKNSENINQKLVLIVPIIIILNPSPCSPYSACDCLCQCRIVGCRRQMSDERLSECRSNLRHRKHRDSSCPANCMLHPASSTDLNIENQSNKTISNRKSSNINSSNKNISSTNFSNLTSAKKTLLPSLRQPHPESDIQICSPSTSNPSKNGKITQRPDQSHNASFKLNILLLWKNSPSKGFC